MDAFSMFAGKCTYDPRNDVGYGVADLYHVCSVRHDNLKGTFRPDRKRIFLLLPYQE